MTAPQLILAGVALVALLVLVVETARDLFRRRALYREIEASDSEEEEEAVVWRRTGLPFHPVAAFVPILLIASWAAWRVGGLLPGTWIAPVVIFVVVTYLLYEFVKEVGRIRTIRFEEKLVSAVDLLVGALRAGENPTRALAVTADTVDQPVRREMEEIVNRLDVGMPIRRALARMMERYGSEGVRMFGSTLAAKWGAGGDLAPVLLKVNRIMRERVRHRLRLRSQLSGAHVAALLVACAPYLILLAFLVLQPEWIYALLVHPAGPPALLGAVALQVVGFVWLSRLIRIEL